MHTGQQEKIYGCAGTDKAEGSVRLVNYAIVTYDSLVVENPNHEYHLTTHAAKIQKEVELQTSAGTIESAKRILIEIL